MRMEFFWSNSLANVSVVHKALSKMLFPFWKLLIVVSAFAELVNMLLDDCAFILFSLQTCARDRAVAADVSLTAVHAYSFPRNLIPVHSSHHILNLMKQRRTWGSRSWRRCTPRRGCLPTADLWTLGRSSGLAGLQCRWKRERLEFLSSLFAVFLRKNTYWAMHFSKRWTALNPRIEKMTAQA